MKHIISKNQIFLKFQKNMKLKENEQILKVIKPHFFTRILLSGYVLFFLIIWIFLYFILWDFFYKILALLAFTQIVVVIFYYLYVYFELWVFVITNLRIIYVKKINIFQSEYADVYLSEFTQIKAKQTWIFAHSLWYGTVFIHTSKGEIILKYVEDALNEAKELMKILKENV